jgi:hypothetical protein
LLTVVSGGSLYKRLHFITLVSFKYIPFNTLFTTVSLKTLSDLALPLHDVLWAITSKYGQDKQSQHM